MTVMPEIDAAKCNGCGLCVAICESKIITMTGNVITILESDKCGWCTECEAVCATGAITCPFEIVIEEE